MLNIKTGEFKILIFVCSSIVMVGMGCKEESPAEKLNQYLASINAQATAMPGSSTPSLPGLPTFGAGTSNVASTAIIGGTPRQVKEGFCGDGIINGPNEDCDLGAIQNVDCRDYNGISGTVTCQANCLYNMSDCINPAVNRHIGGLAETCLCNCNSSICQGGCTPATVNSVGPSTCQFICNQNCVCQCEGKMNARIESCQFDCACAVDTAGNPQCQCSIDYCELLTTISPNIAELATSKGMSRSHF